MFTTTFIEKLPTELFNSHVDYFCLWFHLNGDQGAFNAAKKSRERHTKRRMATICGYTQHRRPFRMNYRSVHPLGPGLWWREVGHSKEPFRLTKRGIARAQKVKLGLEKIMSYKPFDASTHCNCDQSLEYKRLTKEFLDAWKKNQKLFRKTLSCGINIQRLAEEGLKVEQTMKGLDDLLKTIAELRQITRFDDVKGE